MSSQLIHNLCPNHNSPNKSSNISHGILYTSTSTPTYTQFSPKSVLVEHWQNFDVGQLMRDAWLRGWAKFQFQGIVNFVPIVAFHFCLNLPEKFSLPGNSILARPEIETYVRQKYPHLTLANRMKVF